MKRETLSRTAVFVLVSLSGATVHAAGDPGRGAEIFRQNCSECHSQRPHENLVGPSLFSVVGRRAGTIADFSYSDAMKGSGIVWTTDRLMGYLRAPRRYLPGVKMQFPGLPEQQDRENVVAYLATLQP
jgi:cytochrome c